MQCPICGKETEEYRCDHDIALAPGQTVVAWMPYGYVESTVESVDGDQVTLATGIVCPLAAVIVAATWNSRVGPLHTTGVFSGQRDKWVQEPEDAPAEDAPAEDATDDTLPAGTIAPAKRTRRKRKTAE